VPAGSARRDFRMEMIRETTTTEFFFSPDSDFFSSTLPGALANLRLVLKGATMTDGMALLLKLSAWTIKAGRL